MDSAPTPILTRRTPSLLAATDGQEPVRQHVRDRFLVRRSTARTWSAARPCRPSPRSARCPPWRTPRGPSPAPRRSRARTSGDDVPRAPARAVFHEPRTFAELQSRRILTASPCGSPSSGWARIRSARAAASPRSRATIARVRRFGLNGRYRSSSGRLGVAGEDLGPQLVGQKPSRGDRVEHAAPAILELEHVGAALLDGPDLDLGRARRSAFLAVAGDERHVAPSASRSDFNAATRKLGRAAGHRASTGTGSDRPGWSSRSGEPGTPGAGRCRPPCWVTLTPAPILRTALSRPDRRIRRRLEDLARRDLERRATDCRPAASPPRSKPAGRARSIPGRVTERAPMALTNMFLRGHVARRYRRTRPALADGRCAGACPRRTSPPARAHRRRDGPQRLARRGDDGAVQRLRLVVGDRALLGHA